MMQQTTQSETEAAKVRVTPRELAQATAIIEARREAEAKHLADTIALGEAVQQLGLAATPEELFAEVQALRANAQKSAASVETAQIAANSKQQKQNKKKKQLTWNFTFIACTAALFISIFILRLFIAGSNAPVQTSAAVQVQTPAPAMSSGTQNDNLTVGEQNPDEFKSLNLGERESVRCGLDDIEELARGEHPADLMSTAKKLELSWELQRISGNYYVHCWASRANAAKIAHGQKATVAGFKWAQESAPVTLPLKDFINPVSPDTFQDVVSHIQVNGKRTRQP